MSPALSGSAPGTPQSQVKGSLQAYTADSSRISRLLQALKANPDLWRAFRRWRAGDSACACGDQSVKSSQTPHSQRL